MDERPIKKGSGLFIRGALNCVKYSKLHWIIYHIPNTNRKFICKWHRNIDCKVWSVMFYGCFQWI